MRRRRPDLPVLLLSGAAETTALPTGVECLGKPIELSELLARVARALGR
jgi:DNA-binding response OmpR family regulator